MNKKEFENYEKAGKIAQEIRKYSREIARPGIKLNDIAKKIHLKIEELGGECAFPVNLSIDDVAAHYHPTLEDESVAKGLLKVDFGVHVKGFIADTALSIDFSDNSDYKKLIDSAESALKNALKILKKDPTLHEIGLTIQKTIENEGFSPIINLSGHSLDEYKVHSGITIPNYGNNNYNKLFPGAYAIEPFATSGEGKIYEGSSGNIYSITEPRNVRSPKTREILEYVWKKYKTLPFSLREIQERFGGFARLGLRELENNGVIKNYSQLIEKSHKPVAQAEHTFIKTEEDIIILTEE